MFDAEYWESHGIDGHVVFQRGPNVKTVCPRCSDRKGGTREKDLSVNIVDGTWNCHSAKCGWSGGPGREELGIMNPVRHDRVKKVEYAPPPPLKPAASVNGKKRLEAFFAERGIGQDTYESFGIIDDGRSICFPYYRDGVHVNTKHRGPQKKFWMEKGAELILWGIDDIDIDQPVIIVEGEMDRVALAEAGVRNVLSVPAGAPPDKADMSGVELAYLPSGEELFKNAREVVVAGDMDTPGQRLMDEIARRIGRSKCWKVAWPDGCKDGNDTLLNFGEVGVREAIERRVPFPVDGIKNPMDYLEDLREFESDTSSGEPISMWPRFSNLIRFSEGQLTILTGSPGSGKSVWLNSLMMHKSKESGWKWGVFSPEYHPTKLHVRDLVELFLDKPMKHTFPNYASWDEIRDATEHINEWFNFILPPKPALEEVIDRAAALVYRKGIKGLVIDPWTELDQSRPSGMSTTDWVDTCLKAIRRFGRDFGVHVVVVAHPTKMRNQNKDENEKEPLVTPYDISDSRHWYEMADVILSVRRNKRNREEPVEVHVQKVRFRDNGELGTAYFHYNLITRRYTKSQHVDPVPTYSTVPLDV